MADDCQQRAWLIRGSSVRGYNLVPQWLEQGFCSLPGAWLVSAELGMSLAQLKDLVDQNLGYLSYSARRDLAAEAHLFLNRMQTSDIVLTNNEDEIHLGLIVGEPETPVEADEKSKLRRDVGWLTLSHPLDYSDLPAPLTARMSNQGSLIDLTAEWDILRSLLPDPLVEEEPPVLGPIELKQADEDLARRLFLTRGFLQEAIDLLQYRKQIIFYGPPGTGKTYLAQELAWHLTDRSKVKLIQFHPAYSYEDFFEGFRPVSGSDGGGPGFQLMPGPLRRLVDAAKQSLDQPHVLIIDEINRANLAKVFGELYFLLEYRDRSVTPLYSADSSDEFHLPDNVFFIGTMNTTDRSIASLDAAIRRRFYFLELHPSEPPIRDMLPKWLNDKGYKHDTAGLLEVLNESISDRELRIGPSYLMRDEVYAAGGLDRVWRTSILPLLEEYYLGTDIDVRKTFDLKALQRKARQKKR